MSGDVAKLELRGAAFSYGEGRFALSDVSFPVQAGELVGLLGPNGSGKSTVVKLVMRLLSPGPGQVLLDGCDVRAFRHGDYARRVAYVPQESRAAFAFTVMETVLMGRSPHLGAMGFESEADHRAALEALQRVDAARFADVFLDELSGGERQRVILARALAQEAELLILDEPASFLDIRHQCQLYHLLRDLVRRQGRTCLCISHDVNVAAAYCDRLVLLRQGRLAAMGRPAEVLTADLIRRVYDVEAEILTQADGRPVVLPRVD